MIKVAIVVYDGCSPISPIGSLEILNKADVFYHPGLVSKFAPPFFEVKLVSLNGKYVTASGGYPLFCHNQIDEIEKVDLILIAPFQGEVEEILSKCRNLTPWLKKHYEAGADIVSICTGGFLLAETGLLNGKSATTHWAFADKFAERFPLVKLKSHKIIVDEGRICTCGGGFSFSNSVIYLVEKYCGSEVAIYLSKLLVTEVSKQPQNSYAIFSSQKTHADEVILKAQRFMEEKYNEDLPVEEIASEFAVSVRNFIRRFKKATGNTPGQYIQRVRIEAAKKSLENNEDSVQNIVFDIGYDDISTFRKLFKRYTGLSPVDYRKKFMRLG